MAASIKSMKKYLSLVEAQTREAEEILTAQMLQELGHCPSPRVLKRLEESEETIINPDLKQRPKLTRNQSGI